MNKIIGVLMLVGVSLPSSAQHLLTLDSCRAMALRNNKQLSISRMKQDVAANLRKSARTKYLPHVSALGTYQFTSKEISLLNNDQKAALSGMGTNLATGIQSGMAQFAPQMASVAGMLESAGVSVSALQANLNAGIGNLATDLNGVGQGIVDAFRSDTRNIWAGSIMLTQPIFMGGAIVAMNKMADISEQMAQNSMDSKRQMTYYETDRIYWQVVSLKHKQRLAESYVAVVKKLDDDVQKMIAQGVATKSDGLSVSVKVNEAEMALQKVTDGLTLSRMLLCQTVGLPMNEQVVLADEDAETIATVTLQPELNVETAVENRPELKMLGNVVDLSKQATNVLKAGNLPQVLLTGGYAVTNPNLLNGFEKKFNGFWNVGVLVRVPIWNWGDVMYKVRASKGATAMARLQMEEAREKIELQVNQTTFKVSEANKRLAMAEASIKRADENLRMANLGFNEGVIAPTVVMEAQTAWLQAESQRIDAAIDVRLSQVDLQKALGTLSE